MATRKWFSKSFYATSPPFILRKSSNWNSVQRQVGRKQPLVQQKMYIEYQNSFQSVVDKGLTRLRFNSEICDRIKRLVEYNTTRGKQIRGLMMLSTYNSLIKSEEVKEETKQEIFALAWAIEMFHSFFLITDDMTDGAKTRRGQTCWHLLPDVGAQAVNDATIFQSFIYEVLLQHFGDKAVFPQLTNLFNEAYLKTLIGQLMDTRASQTKIFTSFTMDYYIKTINYKTTFYSFQFPLLLALLVSNKASEQSYKLVENLSTDIGFLFQTQNDFLDYYEDESVGGKSGTDIQEGKCTWLAVMALERSNAVQRRTFLDNYGKWEPTSVKQVRSLYDELKLLDVYTKAKSEVYESLVKRIDAMSQDAVPPPGVFTKLVDIAYSIGNIDYKTGH